MNILFIKHFFVGFMVSQIPRVSVFGYFPLYTSNYDKGSKVMLQHITRRRPGKRWS